MRKNLGFNVRLRFLLTLIILITITGCAYYTLVNESSITQIGDFFKVKSPINWSKSKENGVETWTVDGSQLQSLMFFQGVEEGKPLMRMTGSSKESLPVYKSSMTSLEIMELMEATLVRIGLYNIATKNLRPERFGNLDGFRFELDYKNESGLKYNGFVLGTQKDGMLLAIMYIGTAAYHYNKHFYDVEKIISSIEIL